MSTHRDRELLRLLHGELDEAAAARLRRRLASDPRLAARLDALKQTWSVLEPPPNRAVPAGLRRQILSAARTRRAVAEPRWLRAGVAVAMACGMALGFGLDRLDQTPAPAIAPAPDRLATESSLAEAWIAVWQPESGDAEDRR